MCAINNKAELTFRLLPSAAALYFFFFFFFLWPPTVSCQEEIAKCYSPNGDLQINDVPCNKPSTGAGGVSFCCGRGFTCLSNKVCMLSQDRSTGGVTRVGSAYRASCTDKSWNSTECPSFCTVSSCGDHSWCCQSVTADAPYCCTGKDKFTTYNVNENQFVIPAFPSSSNSSSSYSISKPTSQASSNGKNKSQTIALAVGLGIPLAVALAAGLFFYLILRCRRARGRLLSTSASSGDSGGHTEAVEIDFSVTTSSSPVIAEVSGERKYELPVERDIPPAEFYVKPV